MTHKFRALFFPTKIYNINRQYNRHCFTSKATCLANQKGVILLHDNSCSKVNSAKNRTVRMGGCCALTWAIRLSSVPISSSSSVQKTLWRLQWAEVWTHGDYIVDWYFISLLKKNAQNLCVNGILIRISLRIVICLSHEYQFNASNCVIWIFSVLSLSLQWIRNQNLQCAAGSMPGNKTFPLNTSANCFSF